MVSQVALRYKTKLNMAFVYGPFIVYKQVAEQLSDHARVETEAKEVR